MIRSHELPAKIKATNRANAAAMELQQRLQAVFAQFVGQKILKADGSLLAKVEKALPELSCSRELRMWRHRDSRRSLTWGVSASEMVDDTSCTYAEATAYVGGLDGDTLTELSQQRTPLRTDYSFEQVMEARQRTKAAKAVYEDVRAECYPFGED